MNKKKMLSRVGAAGLAAATIVTGLSFGPAANAANLDAKAVAPLTQTGVKLFGKSGNQWLAYSYSGSELTYNLYATKAQAEAAGVALTIPEIGQTGTISDAAGNCLWSAGVTTGGKNHLTKVKCAAIPAVGISEFTLTAEGKITAGGGFLNGWTDGSTRWANITTGGSGTTLLGAATGLPFTADVTSRDTAAKSAVVSGEALPGSVVLVNGTKQVEADPTTGAWTATVEGLKIGETNKVTAEEYVTQNGSFVKKQLRELDVNFEITNLTAEVTPGDLTTEAAVHGIAQAGSKIEVRNARGDVIASTDAVGPLGSYVLPIPAPNAAGDYGITVSQVFEGETLGNLPRTIAYGAGVQVDTPVDDAAHDGGPLAMSGTGKPGSKITVREEGKQTVIGSADVLVNGSWNLNTSNLSNGKHVLVATQASSGKNTTTDTVTINPDATSTAPLVIQTPAYGSTVTLDADSTTVFSGTGEPGATVHMRAGNGRVIFTTTVLANGTWSARGLMAVGTSNPFVDYTVAGTTTTTQHRVTAKAGISQPFTVTTPASGSTVENAHVLLKGKGAPQSTVVLKAGSGRQMMKVDVLNDGTWAGYADFAQGTSNPTFTVTLKDGTTTTQGYTLTVGKPGVTQPLSIDTPAQNSTVESTDGTVTFSGKGTTGAVITFKSGAGSTVAQTTVGKDGTWSAAGMVGFRTANLAYTYTLNGADQTGTQTFTVKKPGVEQAFEVTRPAIGATVTSADGIVTFTGKGATGATVKIGSASSDYFSVKIGNDGTWTGKGYVGYRNAKSLVTYIDAAGVEHKSNLDYTVVAP